MTFRTGSITALFLLVTLAALTGCDSLLPALGSYEQIHVLADREPDEETMNALRDVFEVEFITVEKETLFHLVPVGIHQLKEINNRKNYMVLVDASDRGVVFDLAHRLLGRKALNDALRSKKPRVLFVDNGFSRQQVHGFLIAGHHSAFPQAIRDEGKSIRDTFLQSIRKRILEYPLFRGERLSLARRIYEQCGWWIRIPGTFKVNLDQMDNRFFTMKMDRPGRLLFLYWEEDREILPEPEEVVALRDSIAFLYYDEDYVELSRTETFRAPFQGRDAIRIRGLWQNEKYTIGGPFRSIAFIDEKSNRLYLLDYTVYNPGNPKKYSLWELETVLETFSLEPPPEEESE